MVFKKKREFITADLYRVRSFRRLFRIVILHSRAVKGRLRQLLNNISLGAFEREEEPYCLHEGDVEDDTIYMRLKFGATV